MQADRRALLLAGGLGVVAMAVVVATVLASAPTALDIVEQPASAPAPAPTEPDPEPAPAPPEPAPPPPAAAGPWGEPAPPPPAEPAPPPLPEEVLPPGPPSDQRQLRVAEVIGGNIAPKSVVSTQHGLVLAQNMMYRHTVTVYDRGSRTLVATIEDNIDPAAFGLGGSGLLRGAPVEAAVTPDGTAAYVSNYRMSGPGYQRGGTDVCGPADGYDDSLLYRIDLTTFTIEQAIPVGAVPKYVAVTPDGGTVLVTNWCSYDLSVVDTARGTEVARIDLGRYPRGIAVTPDGTTAYIALMGALDILVVDLDTLELDRLAGVGRSPRHVVLSPDGRILYATINGDGVVARIDLDSGQVATVATGRAPRSMDIAADGRSLYVVNYFDDTVAKVRTADMQVVQTLAVPDRPIGITYDRPTGEVWVASYSGRITVLVDE